MYQSIKTNIIYFSTKLQSFHLIIEHAIMSVLIPWITRKCVFVKHYAPTICLPLKIIQGEKMAQSTKDHSSINIIQNLFKRQRFVIVAHSGHFAYLFFNPVIFSSLPIYLSYEALVPTPYEIFCWHGKMPKLTKGQYTCPEAIGSLLMTGSNRPLLITTNLLIK